MNRQHLMTWHDVKFQKKKIQNNVVFVFLDFAKNYEILDHACNI
jgi:hypothetical protein